jgi:hypothetical protein
MQNACGLLEWPAQNLNYKLSYAPMFHKKVPHLENALKWKFGLIPTISCNIIIKMALYLFDRSVRIIAPFIFYFA